MFVQVIEGKVSDPAGLRRAMDRWNAELRPGAAGFLGSTMGVAEDGTGIAVARFESAAAAKANSDRPEQGEWWADAEKNFGGPVTFTESEDVEEFLAGGSDDAGFVQIMKTPGGPDRAELRALDEQFMQHASTWRPDLIGGLRIWTGPTSTIEVNYFTNEAEARANEQKEPPAELRDAMAKYSDYFAKTQFIDLRDPWFA